MKGFFQNYSPFILPFMLDATVVAVVLKSVLKFGAEISNKKEIYKNVLVW